MVPSEQNISNAVGSSVGMPTKKGLELGYFLGIIDSVRLEFFYTMSVPVTNHNLAIRCANTVSETVHATPTTNGFYTVKDTLLFAYTVFIFFFPWGDDTVPFFASYNLTPEQLEK